MEILFQIPEEAIIVLLKKTKLSLEIYFGFRLYLMSYLSQAVKTSH